ncbi:Phospholipase SGR2 [Forsythia ovata]|uniref:Phospholipase SGR2 n=1 Tax=Forsythia ovata TaxID=205694 RepID=A0ABD1QD85_9LAMI
MNVENEATINSLASSSGEVEQISPDMLKNTDINIRRLADEIQHYEGRQKYLARSSSPSDGGDVRWYLCKVPLGVNGECLAEIKRKILLANRGNFLAGHAIKLLI